MRRDAAADHLAVVTKQEMRASQNLDGRLQLRGSRGLHGSVRGVVAAADRAVTQPDQGPGTIGLQRQDRPTTGEQFDALDARPADPRVRLPWRTRQPQLRATTQTLDAIDRTHSDDHRREHLVGCGEDARRVEPGGAPQPRHRRVASLVVDQIAHVLSKYQLPAVR